MKKDKKWNQLTYKNILWIITYTILLVLAILRLDVLLQGVKLVMSLIKPFVIGFALAYVFSIPMRFFQRKLPRRLS